MTTLRESIQSAITAQGLSVAELARRSGVHRTQIIRYLGGDRDLRGATLEDIMLALGLVVHGPSTIPPAAPIAASSAVNST